MYKKVLILYHSGAGSTKTIAQLYSKFIESDISSIQDFSLTGFAYDFIIFGFPTYHCEPSKSMTEFLKSIPILGTPIPAFVFTTCGLYSGNSLRIFIKQALPKGIQVLGSSVYRAPATDAALLLPRLPRILDFERNIISKLKTDIQEVKQLISYGGKPRIPPFKLYSILNYPNKVLGKAYRHKLRRTNNCNNCRKCSNGCNGGGWSTGEQPIFQPGNCEYCFRCIHHCPREAIILSSRTAKKPKLSNHLFKKIEGQLAKELE